MDLEELMKYVPNGIICADSEREALEKAKEMAKRDYLGKRNKHILISYESDCGTIRNMPVNPIVVWGGNGAGPILYASDWFNRDAGEVHIFPRGEGIPIYRIVDIKRELQELAEKAGE